MAAFQTSMNNLSMSNSVTTFTASEFGRRLSNNGTGTDHGWGNIQLVMGGAVQGGTTYGTWPSLQLDGPDAVNTGRLIPTSSNHQLAATLAQWMGVQQQAEQINILPQLANFNTPTIDLF